MKLCFNIFQNERKYLGNLPQRLQQMAEIPFVSLSELESYRQGKQHIYILSILHARFSFRHFLYDTYCLLVQHLVAAAACYLKVLYIAVLLDNESDDRSALNSCLAKFLRVVHLFLQILYERRHPSREFGLRLFCYKNHPFFIHFFADVNRILVDCHPLDM